MVLSDGTYQIYSPLTNQAGKQVRLAIYDDRLLDANDSSNVRTLPLCLTVVNRLLPVGHVQGHQRLGERLSRGGYRPRSDQGRAEPQYRRK